MGIESLELHDFQKHETFELKLDPHITTIVGSSDSGKSSVIRALYWLARNKPGGDSFIRSGSKQVSVRAVVDGIEILRVKGGGKNTYKANGHVFEAFGSEVPPEVAQLLGISDINFQLQHDGPFWFCETPGEISRRLNKIVNLGLIDSSLANVAKLLTQASHEVGGAKIRMEAAAMDRSRLKFVRGAEEDLKALENADIEISDLSKDILELEQLIVSTEERQSYLDDVGRLLAESKEVIRCGVDWSTRLEELVELTTIITKATEAQSVCTREIPSIEDLEAILADWRIAENTRVGVEKLCAQIQQEKEQAVRRERDLSQLRSVLKKSLGSICPLCLQVIPS